MAKAYDFALDKVGLDMNAYTIYSDYVAFLKSVYVHLCHSLKLETEVRFCMLWVT